MEIANEEIGMCFAAIRLAGRKVREESSSGISIGSSLVTEMLLRREERMCSVGCLHGTCSKRIAVCGRIYQGGDI